MIYVYKQGRTNYDLFKALATETCTNIATILLQRNTRSCNLLEEKNWSQFRSRDLEGDHNWSETSSMTSNLVNPGEASSGFWILDSEVWSEASSMTSNIVWFGLYFRSMVLRHLFLLLSAIRSWREHADIFPGKCAKSLTPCLLLERRVLLDNSFLWGWTKLKL